MKLSVGWVPANSETNIQCDEGFAGKSVSDVNALFHDLDAVIGRELALSAITTISPWRGLGGVKTFRTFAWIYGGNGLFYGYSQTDSDFYSMDASGYPVDLNWGTLTNPTGAALLAPGEAVWWNSDTTNGNVCARYRNTNFSAGGTFTSGATTDLQAYRWWSYSSTHGKYYRMNQAGVIQYATSLTGSYSTLGATTGKLQPCFDPISQRLAVIATTGSAVVEVYENTTLVATSGAIGASSNLMRFAAMINGRLYIAVANSGNTTMSIYRSAYGDFTAFSSVLTISGSSSSYGTSVRLTGNERFMGFRSTTDDKIYFSVDDGVSWGSYYVDNSTVLVPDGNGIVRMFYDRGYSLGV